MIIIVKQEVSNIYQSKVLFFLLLKSILVTDAAEEHLHDLNAVRSVENR